MKKILIILFAVLILIFIAIYLLSRFPKSNNTFISSNGTLPTPLSSNSSLTTSNKTGNQPISTNSTDSRLILTDSTIINLQTYPPDDVAILEKAQSTLPYEDTDVKITYSPVLNRFFVISKTPQAEQKFKEWEQKNNLTNLSHRNSQTQADLYIFGSSNNNNNSVDLQTEMENKVSDSRNQSQTDSQLTSTNLTNLTISTDLTNLTNNNDLSLLTDLFKILLNTNVPSNVSTNNISPANSPVPSLQSPTPASTNQPQVSNPPVTSGVKANNPLIDDPLPLSLYQMLQDASQKVGVPLKLLEAIIRTEGTHIIGYTDEQVRKYSQPGAKDTECSPNECAAIGPMQITINVDDNGNSHCPGCGNWGYCPNAWRDSGSTINKYGFTHTPNPCNIRDSIYAGAKVLKIFSQTKETDNWSRETVLNASAYGGGQGSRYTRIHFPGNPNPNYFEYLWWYYNNK